MRCVYVGGNERERGNVSNIFFRFSTDNIVFYLLLMLSFVNKINSYITFILFNPLVYVVFTLFCILVVLCFFTSNLYYECVK